MGSQLRRWILAFDASCCQCRKIADKVKQSGGDKLDVMPLTHPEVIAWRRQALGDNAPYTPTLIRVGQGDVRAFTGGAMALRLAARLGAGSTVRLLAALGALRKNTATSPAESNGATIQRAQFLRLTGLGVAAVLFGGKASLAYAESAPLTSAQKWVQENKHNLPQNYADFISHDMAHRKAIFAELSPGARSQLWLEQFECYRATNTDMTDGQRQVLDRAVELTGQVFNAAGEINRGADHQQLDNLREAAIAAFGIEQARALLTTLGPAPEILPSGDFTAQATCECSVWSDYCGTPTGCVGTFCDASYCTCTSSGCGTLWYYACDGKCW